MKGKLGLSIDEIGVLYGYYPEECRQHYAGSKGQEINLGLPVWKLLLSLM